MGYIMSTDLSVSIKDSTTGKEMTHFLCCETPESQLSPTLCGAIDDPFDGGYVDTVDCVVCQDLSDSNWCPILGRCSIVTA